MKRNLYVEKYEIKDFYINEEEYVCRVVESKDEMKWHIVLAYPYAENEH